MSVAGRARVVGTAVAGKAAWHGCEKAPLDWDALKDEAAHFGSAQAFIDRVLAEARSK